MAESSNLAAVLGRAVSRPPASQVRQWGSALNLSSPAWWEAALAERSFERMPWLAVALLAGILAWFALPARGDWLILLGVCGLLASAALAWCDPDRLPHLRAAILGVALFMAAGVLLVWARSELVGARPIGNPMAGTYAFRVLDREERDGGARLKIATDEAAGERVVAQVFVRASDDRAWLAPGAVARARIRLVPPERALVPGAYDRARAAWFEGIAAQGSLLGPPEPIAAGRRGPDAASRDLLSRAGLSRAVRESVAQTGAGASASAIAATLLTGDRAGIAESDDQAMRDAGLAHLLSISGLHVGAVVAIAWFCAMRSLALWPWLALRVPLPLVASAVSALAGIGYTLLTGAEYPTVRACLAALLVLAALALGRQALSLRLIALAAIAVLVFLPEAAVSASFQLSFAAVIAIVALHGAAPVRRWREKARERSRAERAAIWLALLLLTGVVIEATLMPLVLFHFQRAGLYGAAVNLVAIPLSTFIIMPLLIAAAAASVVGLGWPFWALAGRAIDLMLDLAHVAAASPGSVVQTGAMPPGALLAMAIGALWLALWSGTTRLYGMVPIAVGIAMAVLASGPEVMVDGEGRHVALRGPGGSVYLLRPAPSFRRDTILQIMGADPLREPQAIRPLTSHPQARCNDDFCSVTASEGAAATRILIARTRAMAHGAALTRACRDHDIVIAQRALPADCTPRWLRLGGSELSRHGGVAINLAQRSIRHVRPAEDRHGW